MIKTMLLTAQLALSPIVGTNGLQPKYLPNPVYGEEVNLSVKYNGETYTRLSYINEETKAFGEISSTINKYLSFNEKGILFYGFDTYSTNLGTGNDENYIALEFDTDGSQYIESHGGGNVCVSFYAQSVDDPYYYYEIFEKGVGGLSVNIYWYDTQWKEVKKGITDLGEHELKSISLTPINDLPPCTLGNIPQYQPTIANPSVYDNIYNFYYQNLFANEALDELGAEVGKNSLTMRQWLAHTATIVSISLLSAALVILVIKIFKLIAGSISDIWG